MKLGIFASAWAFGGLEACRRELDGGVFDGIEGPPPSHAPEISALRQSRVPYIAEICSGGSYAPASSVSFERHWQDLREQVTQALHCGALFCSCLVGSDSWPLSVAVDFFGRALELGRGLGAELSFETHRSRPTFHPWATRALLEALPELRITCDFSHWCVVCERLPDDDALALPIARARHMHARVGYAQGPQVPDPRAPEFELELATHDAWWRRIAHSVRARGPGLVSVTPEFGPDGYLQQAPYTRRPVADLAELNRWMALRQRHNLTSIVDRLGQPESTLAVMSRSSSCTLFGRSYTFADLRELMAKATPKRSGDELAGVAAQSAEERVAAQICLAEVPLSRFLQDTLIPYESDEVTRLIVDSHDMHAFAPVSGLTVGELRNWLLAYETDGTALRALAPGLTPEMVAAVTKLMGNQDLVLVARKCSVVTRFRSTIGLPGTLAVRLQPNHPSDDLRGVAASVFDGLLYGCGDAVIGINPATDNLTAIDSLLHLLDDLIMRHQIPTQSCVLAHVTTQLEALRRGAPLDLMFQSIAGTEAANRSFGVSLSLLTEAQDATLALKRGTIGDDVMYFETGQGSALSAGAHHGVDQQTLEVRAYAVARRYKPLLVNTVVGFIGPEYLYDGKQIIRAGLEDHCAGKLLGLPMGVDVCYTNHAEADQDDMDTLLTLLGVAGCNYVMGVPGADDIMLGYQSTSFHDSHYLRQVLGLRPAPEFEAWLAKMRIVDGQRLLPVSTGHDLLLDSLAREE